MDQGPNVRKLIVWKMARLAVPAGPPDAGLVDGLALFTEPGKLGSVAGRASDWVARLIAVVKEAPDNPYGDDDEAVAGACLDKIDGLRAREGGD